MTICSTWLDSMSVHEQFLNGTSAQYGIYSAMQIRQYDGSTDLRSFEIQFDSNRPIPFDSKVMGRFANFRIGRACPLLVVVKRLKPLTVLSSMSDHTLVLFNVFKDGNEESVVPHISFDSIRIRFELKRPIRRSLDKSSQW